MFVWYISGEEAEPLTPIRIAVAKAVRCRGPDRGSQVRSRLAGGAKGIRTPGPTVNGADTEGRPTPTIAPSPESAAYRSGISLRQHVGPGVRNHFAPAASRLRT